MWGGGGGHICRMPLGEIKLRSTAKEGKMEAFKRAKINDLVLKQRQEVLIVTLSSCESVTFESRELTHAPVGGDKHLQTTGLLSQSELLGQHLSLSLSEQRCRLDLPQA